MNIQSNYNYNCNNVCFQRKKAPENTSGLKKFTNKLKQKILNTFSERNIKDDEQRIDKFTKINDKITRPAENRIILGSTAIVLQPIIDSCNKRVDDETRRVSRNRTIAKIIAGTAVGILVRGSCYKLVKNMTNMEGTKKLSQALIPKMEKFKTMVLESSDSLDNYRNALSTSFAIGVMLFTNFLLDAPLTTLLTNHLNAKTSNKKVVKEDKNV